MSGFMGWFLTFVFVVAIFNAEKLPALRSFMEDKLKSSLDAAKEGSKAAKSKIEQVKTDMENKKNTPARAAEQEENTPEEIEEALNFMGQYTKPAEKPAENTAAPEPEQPEPAKKTEEKPTQDAPVDLEHRY